MRVLKCWKLCPLTFWLWTIRDLRNYSNDRDCSLLLDNIHIMNKLFYTDDVDNQVRIFNEYFLGCLDACAPKVMKVIKGQPTPWINNEVRSAIIARNDLQNKLKHDMKNCILREQYKTAKKQVKSMISKLKRALPYLAREVTHLPPGRLSGKLFLIKSANQTHTPLTISVKKLKNSTFSSLRLDRIHTNVHRNYYKMKKFCHFRSIVLLQTPIRLSGPSQLTAILLF